MFTTLPRMLHDRKLPSVIYSTAKQKTKYIGSKSPRQMDIVKIQTNTKKIKNFPAYRVSSLQYNIQIKQKK
tara:strand:+ start:562 stop:774 length:213 start_codon:yes stop_codon:yes gene_type:complete